MNVILLKSACKLRSGLKMSVQAPFVAKMSYSKEPNTMHNGTPSSSPNHADPIKSDETHATQDSIDESQIQPEWLAMERRLSFRKPKLKGEGKEGRSPRRGSAWDAEHV